MMARSGTCGAACFVLVAALVLASAGVGSTARAQATAMVGATDTGGVAKAATGAESADEIRALVATLEDEAARGRLIAQLNALLAAKARAEAPAERRGGARFIDQVSERMRAISDRLVAGAGDAMDLAGAWTWLHDQAGDADKRRKWLALAWKVAAVLALGWLAHWVVRLVLARPRRAFERRQSPSLPLRLMLVLGRGCLDIVPVAVFAAVAYVVLPLLEPDRPTRLVALVFVNAVLIVGVVLAAARAVFAPHAAALRLFAIDDVGANYGYLWVRRFATVAVYGYLFTEVALLLGLPIGAYHAVRLLLGLLLALMAVALVLQNRDAIGERIRGAVGVDDAAPSRTGLLRRRLADVWHVLAIVYVIATFAIWALDVAGGFALIARGTVLGVVIIGAAALANSIIDQLIDKGLGIGEEARRRFPGLEARADRYFAVIRHGLRTVVYLVASVAFLQAWSVDAFGWAASDAGRAAIGSIVTVVLLIVVAVVILELASSAIERHLAREEADGAASPRAHTLLPLLRTALMALLAVLVAMVGLSEFGVDIGPLLAGAGIIGLAFGFGAQTLVKDIITGFFILMEDQLAVGDVVRVGSHAGLVEELTIRTIRLRDLGGNVHIIPFSEVTTLENMTREFSRYVFDVGVAYREDTDAVVAALQQVGDEMMAEDYYADLILQPLEILGVDQFADSAVVIKARITTKPIKQWEVGREFNRRMKKRFDELGIEIPFPHQTIYFGEAREGGAPPAFVRLERGAAPARSAPSGEPAPTAHRPDRGIPEPDSPGTTASHDDGE